MNRRRCFGFAISITLCLIASAALLLAMDPPASADGTTRHVATAGTDSGNCTDPSNPCRTVQYAVNAAAEGDVIKIATGVYTSVYTGEQLTPYFDPPLVEITKSLTLRGGYTPAFSEPPDSGANPTTLEGGWGRGVILRITGDITTTIESLRLIRGYGEYFGVGAMCGGVHLKGGRATFISNLISESEIGGYTSMGGGICSFNSHLTLIGNTIAVNYAWGTRGPNHGGGLYANGGELTLIDNDIRDNRVTGASTFGFLSQGGGLYLWQVDAELSGNRIVGNTLAVHGLGGGLCARESRIRLLDNLISSNLLSSTLPMWSWGVGAVVEGGGLYLIDSDAELSRNVIVFNSAGAGGGLSLTDSTATLRNNVLARNVADIGSGLYTLGSQATLLHTTIAANRGGAGLEVAGVSGGDATLANTILVSHTVGISVAAGSQAGLAHTLWGSDAWANGLDATGAGTITLAMHNYWGDPLFVDPLGGDYHILPDSAAVDKGPDVGVRLDLDGDVRPDGCGFDLGADEFITGAECRRVHLPLILRNTP